MKKGMISALILLALVIAMACDVSAPSDSGTSTDDPGGSNTISYGEDDVLYVSVAGSDSYTGTQSKPFKTIQFAVNIAASHNFSEIHVSQGVYSVDGADRIGDHTSSGVCIKKDVSLYGGYSTSWSMRNPAVYTTTIRDATTVDSGSFSYPNRVIYLGPNITSSACIDGFTIRGGAGEYNSGIFMDGASATITNNVIYGGSSTGSENYGITTWEGSPVIENNDIHGGDGPVYTRGINTHYTSARIIGNHIHGGGGTTAAYGIDEYYSASLIMNNIIDEFSTDGVIYGITLTGSATYIVNNVIKTSGFDAMKTCGIANQTSQVDNITCYIYNNSIDGGDGDLGASGITLTEGHVYINNNIIFLTGGSAMNSFGICEEFSDSDPLSVDNNAVYNCATALYRDDDYIFYDAYMTSVAGGNFVNADGGPMIRPTGHGNLNVNPYVNVSTLACTSSTPLSVKQGGKNLSALFTTDINGNTRTVPWSIGAFESD